MNLTRREFLSFTVSAAALGAIVGCGGSGGSNSSQTVLALTEQQFDVVFDPERSIGNSPYVTALKNKNNGQTVMSGDLFFTVNGQPFYENGQTGNKSVQSTISAGDQIAWQTL